MLNKLKNLRKQALYIIVIAAFIGINILISTLPLRLDLSYGKAYTLSSSTKKIIKDLTDTVNIKFFVSADLPTRILPLKNDVIDFLNEYKKSGGKINVQVIDPKKDDNALKEVQNAGIPELQVSQVENDKYAVSSSYFGILLTYKDKKEIIPQVTDLESLEYNLTASIYKMVKKELPKIGIVGTDNSYNPQGDNLTSFKKIISQQFTYNFIDFTAQTEKKEIDPSFKTILVLDDNKKEFSDNEVKAIKSYLDKKGKAIFFTDGIWVDEMLATSEAKHNLSSIISEYGIKINNDLILSTSAELVNFGNQSVSFLMPYPFWVKTNNFSPKTAYFSNIQQLTFPWVASISTLQNDTKITELVKTTKNSWEQKGVFNLDPQTIPQPKLTDLKEYLIAVQAEKQDKGEIIVIPSSRFILERFLGRNSGNLEFVLNILNDFASGGALSGIRQRAVVIYPLPDITDNQKDIFKYVNILLLPVLLAIYGGIRLIKRK